MATAASTDTINITNVNVTNVYRNSRYQQRHQRGRGQRFPERPVQQCDRAPAATRSVTAGAIRGQMPFTGGPQNQRFSDRQATVIPRGNQNTRFFTHQQPNPVQRGQFNRGGSRRRVRRRVAAAAATRRPRRKTIADRVSPQSNDAGGWRRFGSPSGQPAAGQGNQPAVNRNGSRQPGAGTSGTIAQSPSPQVSQPAAPRNDNRGGWQRFGIPGRRQRPGAESVARSPRQEYRGTECRQAQLGSGVRPGRNRCGSRLRWFASAPAIARRSYRRAAQQSAPSYNAPRQSAPSYSAPRQSAPSYSAPRQSAPSYSAPRSRVRPVTARQRQSGGSRG